MSSDSWTIQQISTATNHSANLCNVDAVEAIAAKGLAGDRHFGNPARHVTIQSLEELNLAAERLGRPIQADLTRRNITVTEGLLPRTRGLRLAVGDVVLEVFADAAPCNLMEELSGPGAKAALKRLAGIHCKVVTGGVISRGESIRVIGERP